MTLDFVVIIIYQQIIVTPTVVHGKSVRPRVYWK